MEKEWSLYILRCGDRTYYTGIAVDVAKRFRAHCAGKGAKYTRGRGPLTLVYQEKCGSHSAALQRECYIKSLSRAEKEKLLAQYSAQQDSRFQKRSGCATENPSEA